MIVKNKIYTDKSELLKYTLENRYLNKKKEFPKDSKDYPNIFKNIEEYLNNNLHNEVVIGAALSDNTFLNDHGEDHIKMVIQRAELLIENKIKSLTGYEIFILLISIHFHDVGNIYGRDMHEKKIFEIMNNISHLIDIDLPTKKTICEIAGSHGGMIEGTKNKDTISILEENLHLQGIEIRPRLLASIVRFADEIADDHTRAAKYSILNLPKKNEIFHFYSKSLQPAAIKNKELILKFDFSDTKLILEKLGKQNSKDPDFSAFLYDEIFIRVQKCFTELKYCKRFAKDFIDIEKIKVTISIYSQTTAIYSDGFVLMEQGYPNGDIHSFIEPKPKITTGEELKVMIEERLTKNNV